jgi:DNA-binding response OmpR family regulator
MKTSPKTRRPRKQDPLIFLVDRPELLEFYATVLHDAGYSRLTAFTAAEEALRTIKSAEERPRLLITAYLLDSERSASMNGLALIAESRRVYPDLVALLTSGLPMDRIRGALKRAKVKPDAFLEKEGGMPRLKSTVNELLERTRVRRSPTRKKRVS